MVEVTGHRMLAVRAVMAAKWPRDRADGEWACRMLANARTMNAMAVKAV